MAFQIASVEDAFSKLVPSTTGIGIADFPNPDISNVNDIEPQVDERLW